MPHDPDASFCQSPETQNPVPQYGQFHSCRPLTYRPGPRQTGYGRALKPSFLNRISPEKSIVGRHSPWTEIPDSCHPAGQKKVKRGYRPSAVQPLGVRMDITILPLETNRPLFVYSDAMLSFSISGQSLKLIARWNPNILDS